MAYHYRHHRHQQYSKGILQTTLLTEFYNLDEMGQFLENHQISKLTQNETDNWNRLKSINGIEFLLKIFQKKYIQTTMMSLVNSTKEEITPYVHNLFPKIEEEIISNIL